MVPAGTRVVLVWCFLISPARWGLVLRSPSRSGLFRAVHAVLTEGLQPETGSGCQTHQQVLGWFRRRRGRTHSGSSSASSSRMLGSLWVGGQERGAWSGSGRGPRAQRLGARHSRLAGFWRRWGVQEDLGRVLRLQLPDGLCRRPPGHLLSRTGRLHPIPLQSGWGGGVRGQVAGRQAGGR